MEEQYKRLANEIRQKSQQCLIAWSPSNYRNTYEASLGKGALLIQHVEPEDMCEEDTPSYSLSFLNERGEIFHTMAVYLQDTSTSDYNLLKDIYEYAHSSYMKIDETLKSMFEDINSK